MCCLSLGSLLACGCSVPAGNADTAKVDALQKQLTALENRVKDLEKLNGRLEEVESRQKSMALLLDQRQAGSSETPAPVAADASPTPSPAPAGPEKQTWKLDGKWVTNKGEISLRATQVDVVRRWEQAAPFIRLGKENEAMVQHWQGALGSGQQKLVLVHAELRNESKEHIGLGANVMNFKEMGIYIRGEEGTEFYSCDSSKNSDNSSCHLTPLLGGGFPANADTPPKGVVSGRIAYLVPDWYVPVTLFVKAGGWTAGPELAVSLKQK